MNNTNDVSQQFATFFIDEKIKPYAYLLYKRLQEGHICIHVDDVLENQHEIPYQKFIEADTLPTLTNFISTNGENLLPFVLHNNRLYFQRYFSYETQILKSISRLLQNEKSLLQERLASLERVKSFVEDLKASYSISGISNEEQIDWQIVAAIQTVLHDFSIITGGPGTGKTTTVAKILSILFTINPNTTVALAAPTGKAAMRMAESLKQTELPVDQKIKDQLKLLIPNTIHRLLKNIPESIYFRYNKSNPLPYDVVIVDEASMIDVAMFAKLLDAIGSGTRIILLGDKNQLASVEAGSLFGDLCKSIEKANQLDKASADFINQFIPDAERKISDDYLSKIIHPLSEHIVELKKSHRFTSIGGIGKLSHSIINNDEKTLIEFANTNKDDSVVIVPSDDSNYFEKFIEGYRDFLLEMDIAKALQKFNQLRVLCAVREGPQGIYAINKAIENYLIRQNLINTNVEFYENRPIIITRSYKDLKLFNGDIGIIRRDENNNLRAWFEDENKNIRSVMPGYISDAETVFAMTIHKSQGSEYTKVMVVLPKNSASQLLTRELLYTAVTRAKESVMVQVSETDLLDIAKVTVKRTSGIIDRFKEI